MYNDAMRFQYDPIKADGNLKKHGVSFADAEGSLPIRSPFIVWTRMRRLRNGLLPLAWGARR